MLKDKIMKNDSITTRMIIVGRIITLVGVGLTVLQYVLGGYLGPIFAFGDYLIMLGGIIWAVGYVTQGFLQTRGEGARRVVWTGRITLVGGLTFVAPLFILKFGAVGLAEVFVLLLPGILLWITGWILQGRQLQ